MWVDPHLGQAIVSLANSARTPPARAGGAIPNSLSLRRPSSVMSSVVHGGDSTVSTVGVGEARLRQRRLDGEADRERRRAARVGRGELDDDAPLSPLHPAQDAQILQRQHRNLRIEHRRSHAIGVLGAFEVRGVAGDLPLRRGSPLPLAGRGWGWGSKRVDDRVHHAFDILSDLGIPDPHDTEALVSQILLPPLVSGDLPIGAVGTTIDLDDEAVRQAREVDNAMIDGHLLPELEARVLQIAELPPQPALGERPAPPQCTYPFVGHGERGVTPTPNPSPQGGGGSRRSKRNGRVSWP